MSLFICESRPDAISVITDTLMTDIDGSPSSFVSKVTIVPHAGVVIFSTGIFMLTQAWSMRASRLPCSGLDELDREAPHGLRESWAEIQAIHDIGDLTSSVYQAGWSTSLNRYAVNSYKSTEGFASTPLPADTAFVKPPPTVETPAEVALTAAGNYNTRDEWLASRIRYAVWLRDAEDVKPDGVGIGGHLVETVLSEQLITTEIVYRFDDYDADLEQITARWSG